MEDLTNINQVINAFLRDKNNLTRFTKWLAKNVDRIDEETLKIILSSCKKVYALYGNDRGNNGKYKN